MEIKFAPDLSACIETVARKEYERILRELLNKRKRLNNEYLQHKLELLQIFLENADLARLRSECEEYLLLGHEVDFKIKSEEDGFDYEIDLR